MAILCLVSATLADDKKPDPKNPTLSGEWQAVSGRFNGNDLPADTIKKRTLQFGEKEFTAYDDGKKGRTITFTLDAAKSPKQIDLTLPTTDMKAFGLYAFVEGKLHICYGQPGEARPEKLDSKAGSKVFLLVLERIKE